MSYVETTYTTTLLCDVVNEEKTSLAQILRTRVEADAEQVSDDYIKLIDSELVVYSWSDFLEKFTPTLFEIPIVDPKSERISMVFSTKNPGHENVEKITFTKNNPLVQSFLQLLERRTMDGQTNAYFDFSEALKNSMSPQTLHKKAEVLKGDMLYLANEYEKLEKGDPEKDVIGRRLATKLQETRIFFQNKTSLLQLAQTTVGQQLLAIASPAKGTNAQSKPLALNYASFDITEEGIQAQTLELSAPTNHMAENDAGQQLLLSYVGKYYDKVTETTEEYVENEAGEFVPVSVEEKRAPYQKQLVLSALTGSTLTAAIDNLPQTVQQYNMYVDATASVMENYFEAVSELFSKIIGVKQFFDEYEQHTKNQKVKPRLLIANATVEELVAEKERLNLYIKTTHNKAMYKDHGFVAVIVPNVSLQEKEDQTLEFDDLFAELSGESAASDAKGKTVDIADVKTIAQLFSPYRVPVCFGFAGEEATFKEMVTTSYTRTLKPFLQKLKDGKGEWQKTLVPCYPNFTIIPQNTKLTTATQVTLDGETLEQGRDRNIQMPGFYIDASYVAASLIAAHTCTGYVIGKYKINESDIQPEFSGARISYAEKRTQTLLPIEVKSISESLLNDLDQLGVGIVFTSQNIAGADGKIRVYSANTCEQSENGKSRALYRMLVERFVDYEIGQLDTAKDYDKMLDTENRRSLGRKIKEGRSLFNTLFQENERVAFDEQSNALEFTFNEETSRIQVKIQANR